MSKIDFERPRVVPDAENDPPITRRYIRDALRLGAQQASVPTRSALRELAGIKSIEQLLRSPNAGRSGK